MLSEAYQERWRAYHKTKGTASQFWRACGYEEIDGSGWYAYKIPYTKAVENGKGEHLPSLEEAQETRAELKSRKSNVGSWTAEGL